MAIPAIASTQHPLQLYTPPDYLLITDGRSLADHLQAIHSCPYFGLDTETTGYDPHQHRLRLVQIAASDYPVLIIDLFTITTHDLTFLQTFLQSPAVKIGHNLKFDWQFLAKAGLELTGPLFDTQLAYRVYTAGLKVSLKLSALAETLLHIRMDKTLQTSDFSGELTAEQLRYAAGDAAILLNLYDRLLKQLNRDRRWRKTAELEFRCIPSTAAMELNGMRVDFRQWQHYGASLLQQRDLALAQLKHLHRPSLQLSLLPELTNAINPNSPKQLLQALQALGVSVRSTSEQELVTVASEVPIVQALLEYRRLNKIATVFETSLPQHIHPVTGRLHANWFQYGARSGRFSCRSPALQTIPRHPAARQCFVAEPGWKLVKGDLGQIELRIVAKLSQDQRLTAAFQRGEDIHRLTASLILGKAIDTISDEERQLAKAVIFGLIYGMGAARLQVYAQTKYGIQMTPTEAKQFSKRFFQAFPGIKRWHQQLQKRAYAQDIRECYTLFGRRRCWSSKPKLTELLNHPVQGLNADMLKIALVKLRQPLARLGAKLIGVIHDEILLECPVEVVAQTCQTLERCMIRAAEQFLRPIPVVVEIVAADSWGGGLTA